VCVCVCVCVCAQSLHNMEDGGGGVLAWGDEAEEDEDDEEFVLSYQELFGMGGEHAPWTGQVTLPALLLYTA